jgi:hypothetical protein
MHVHFVRAALRKDLGLPRRTLRFASREYPHPPQTITNARIGLTHSCSRPTE